MTLSQFLNWNYRRHIYGKHYAEEVLVLRRNGSQIGLWYDDDKRLNAKVIGMTILRIYGNDSY